MTKTYDRQDGETTKAYTAFSIYRDMGSVRSLDRVEEKIYGTQIGHKRGTNLTSLKRWSRDWDWVDRCRDYDLDEEMILRDQIRQSSLEEHNRKLEQFRQHNEAIGFGLFKMGLRLLATGEKIIKTFEDKEVLDSKDIDLFLAIPNSIKAIGALGASGSDLAADGLLIRQLMEKLKESEN